MGRRHRRDLSMAVCELGLAPLDRQMTRRPFNAPVKEPMSQWLMRCCQDSIKFHGPDQAPTEGLEVPCQWCEDSAVFRKGEWRSLRHEPVQP